MMGKFITAINLQTKKTVYINSDDISYVEGNKVCFKSLVSMKESYDPDNYYLDKDVIYLSKDSLENFILELTKL